MYVVNPFPSPSTQQKLSDDVFFSDISIITEILFAAAAALPLLFSIPSSIRKTHEDEMAAQTEPPSGSSTSPPYTHVQFDTTMGTFVIELYHR
jgi:hypothetical protein